MRKVVVCGVQSLSPETSSRLLIPTGHRKDLPPPSSLLNLHDCEEGNTPFVCMSTTNKGSLLA